MLANIGGPHRTKISAGERPLGSGNKMAGHAAHEAQQGSADTRHKATGAGPADKSLTDWKGRFPLSPFAGLEVGATSGCPQPFPSQHAQHTAASGGQGDFSIKGAIRAGAILSFSGGYGRMRAGKLFAPSLVPPPPPPSIGGFFVVHEKPSGIKIDFPGGYQKGQGRTQDRTG